ncbi:DUF4276 family protein [Candidatus Poribacteria bacterium]|nr:DUF4276 family protein [Candidatus Poribacteria bacterium]
MTRLHILTEGPTELGFFERIVFPSLHSHGISPSVSLTGYAKRTGGDVRFARVRDHVLRLLKHDPGLYCATFYDYYGMGKDFPGKETIAAGDSTGTRYGKLTRSMHEQILAELPGLNPRRFLPHFRMHEFEGLLFSDPDRAASAIGGEELRIAMTAPLRECGSPEEIDDSPGNAPSKRLLRMLPGYNKPQLGLLAAAAIGLDVMRRECPLFNAWIASLLALGGPP